MSSVVHNKERELVVVHQLATLGVRHTPAGKAQRVPCWHKQRALGLFLCQGGIINSRLWQPEEGKRPLVENVF